MNDVVKVMNQPRMKGENFWVLFGAFGILSLRQKKEIHFLLLVPFDIGFVTKFGSTPLSSGPLWGLRDNLAKERKLAIALSDLGNREKVC